ncbi:MAG: bifunctional 5,10-methylenetetrahydrofolate dehydrogenase/5,10-methenyltetrahydrofolate cyclohydrolase [Spirochaetales bacterium]|nr:bifunctional 5,10-methylenetetrahydrofolate dehydrogenase/5,10-methenyltetrahydrofolate cyclohydrolase [Spirochaetales bacterium]
MVVLSGKELSAVVRSETALRSAEFLSRFSRRPCLSVILVGDDPASQTYVNSKRKACDELGIEHRDYFFDSSIGIGELLECIDSLNRDDNVDGILVQLPLPRHLDKNIVINAVDPEKDVDGFHPQNMGRLLLGQKTLISCTPKGILRILDHYGIQTAGKNVCIMGRSNIVGKPMAALLMQKGRDATVTVCHTVTKDEASITRNSDIVIVATGRVDSLRADMVKPGAVVIDVGVNRIPDPSKKAGYVLRGDADYEGISEIASAMTPVPGGVGPMTIAMLMENTLQAAFARMEKANG